MHWGNTGATGICRCNMEAIALEVLIKRSARRRKTIQARMVGGKMEVLAPASISDAALQGHIEKLRNRLEKRVYPKDDDHLHERARNSEQPVLSGIFALEQHPLFN